MKTWFVAGVNGGMTYLVLEVLFEKGDRVVAATRKSHTLNKLQVKDVFL
ncbi:MAG: hypothetical protein LBL41_04205 [Bifidobacteriaceae bacterium]|jgi:NAD(P)-dependent dehydrogenase (short-subunit alcohol dehydrogenase family)|nr:hypothetical protein [Bifidobacteriaceae bacterium]